MDELSDYARAIVFHFLARRRKGSAVSSIDQQVIADWEARGVSLDIVLVALDEAFAAEGEPPKSLSDCRRRVDKYHAALNPDPDAPQKGKRRKRKEPEGNATASEQPAGAGLQLSLADQLLSLLQTDARLADAALARASSMLADEVRAIVQQEGALPLALCSQLDAAFLDLAATVDPTRFGALAATADPVAARAALRPLGWTSLEARLFGLEPG